MRDRQTALLSHLAPLEGMREQAPAAFFLPLQEKCETHKKVAVNTVSTKMQATSLDTARNIQEMCLGHSKIFIGMFYFFADIKVPKDMFISHSVKFENSFILCVGRCCIAKFMQNEWAGEWRMRARVVCVLFCCQNMQLSKFYISASIHSNFLNEFHAPLRGGKKLFLHALNNTWAVIGRRKCQMHACTSQQRYARDCF